LWAAVLMTDEMSEIWLDPAPGFRFSAYSQALASGDDRPFL